MRLVAPVPLAALLAVAPPACSSAPSTRPVARRDAGAAAPAERAGAEGVENLYPYVVPRAYLAYVDEAGRALARPLGHDLYVVIVFDLEGLVRNVTAADLRRLGLTGEEAHARALRNLEDRARAGGIDMASFQGPLGKPFVLVGGTWAAASILLPGLRDVVGERIGTMDVCASIPHRDAMLLFSKGDRAYRDAMRALVREKESDGRKPLTFDLFVLTDSGPRPFDEPSR